MPRPPSAKPANPPSTSANLDSIARELGVAVSTVSRALRNHPGIHPTTRLRIQTEAARLGYAVRSRADERNAAGGKTAVRHLLTLAQSNNHTSQLGYLAGISRAAQAHDIGVFSHHCHASEAERLLDPDRQPAALRLPDLVGVIFIHRWPEDIVARIAATRPAISIIHRYSGLPVDTVGTDDEGGLRLVVAHLRERGHRRIGFFGYQPTFSWSRSRFAAFVGALAEAGLPNEPEDVLGVSVENASNYLPPDLAPSLPQIRARMAKGVTAWVCSSYVLAQALIRLLQAEGCKIPGDVAVTGCHGGLRVVQPGSLHPTSFETDDEALGAAVVHLLDQRALRAVPSGVTLLLPSHLLQGESTLEKPLSKRRS